MYKFSTISIFLKDVDNCGKLFKSLYLKAIIDVTHVYKYVGSYFVVELHPLQG